MTQIPDLSDYIASELADHKAILPTITKDQMRAVAMMQRVQDFRDIIFDDAGQRLAYDVALRRVLAADYPAWRSFQQEELAKAQLATKVEAEEAPKTKRKPTISGAERQVRIHFNNAIRDLAMGPVGASITVPVSAYKTTNTLSSSCNNIAGKGWYRARQVNGGVFSVIKVAEPNPTSVQAA